MAHHYDDEVAPCEVKTELKLPDLDRTIEATGNIILIQNLLQQLMDKDHKHLDPLFKDIIDNRNKLINTDPNYAKAWSVVKMFGRDYV